VTRTAARREIDFEDDLALSPFDAVARADGCRRFAPRHRPNVGYCASRRQPAVLPS
jgi:hypothetical protein